MPMPKPSKSPDPEPFKRPDPVAFIKNDDAWPHWPRLPMKRYTRGRGIMNMECGILAPLAPDGKATLYEANLFQNITEETHKTTYPNAEALLADGWEID